MTLASMLRVGALLIRSDLSNAQVTLQKKSHSCAVQLQLHLLVTQGDKNGQLMPQQNPALKSICLLPSKILASGGVVEHLCPVGSRVWPAIGPCIGVTLLLQLL